MTSIKQFQEQFQLQLAHHYDGNEISAIFQFLAEDFLGWKRAEQQIRQDDQLSAQQISRFQHVLQQLQLGRPLQYVLGKAWFMNRPFIVNENVLIPRPETEELVQKVINDHQQAKPALRMIDIGTGSGCIPISLKLQYPEALVSAVEVSMEALKVAKANALTFHVHINFLQCDILEWDTVFMDEQQYDVIVSNPPYVTEMEKEGMHANVLLHEPHLALFVEGHTPLLFYETIASFALQHLQKGGKLYFEINRNYGQEVCALLRKKGFQDVELLQDMQGADRIIRAVR